MNADGVTRTVDLASKDKSIYPLSVLVSAALSTKADKATRGQMADFLDYVDGPGQVPGDEVGKLPGGHAPLTPALRAQVARRAAPSWPVAATPSRPTSRRTRRATDPTSQPTTGRPRAEPARRRSDGLPTDPAGGSQRRRRARGRPVPTRPRTRPTRRRR